MKMYKLIPIFLIAFAFVISMADTGFAQAPPCGGDVVCSCGYDLTSSRVFNESDILTGCEGNGLIISASDITLDCNNTEISGIGSNYGILVSYDNITVKNCKISNFSDGIYVFGKSNLTVENNTIYDMANDGISGWSGSDWIKIIDNEIYNVNDGIDLIAMLDGDIIENNYIHDASNSGIRVASISNADINNNNITNNGGYGLYIINSDNVTLEDNDFTSNAYDGIYSESSDVYVTNGNFINNGYDSEVAYGIYDNSGPSVHWTVTESVDCINNSIYLWGDMTGIENVNSENCPIYVNDECVSGDCPVECGLYASEDFTFTGDMECYSGTFAGVTVQADNITIDCNGYSITKNEQTGHGIDVSGYTNVTIKNCEVSGFFNGIVLSNSDNSTINNNYVYDNSHHNIEIKSGSDYNIISRNRVETGFVGINLKASANNDVWHNTAFNNSAAGIRLSGASGSDVYNNTISNNVESIGNGIDVGSSSTENVIRGNTITENRVGIFYADSGENLIANNNINNNCEGMLVSNADVDIEDTDFTENSEFALEECDQYASPGLNVQSSSVDILNSNFENNGWYGIYGDSDSEIYFTIDDETSCTNNVLRYYGEISDSEDLIRTNCPIAIGSGEDMSGLCNYNIDGDLTLSGNVNCVETNGLIVNADGITIDCNGWSISGPGGSYNGIYVSEFDDVTIKNCDINSFEYGVYVYDSDNADILNNLITDATYGVYINGTADSSGDHMISGNTIDAISTNAIYIYNESSNTVRNNKIRYVDGSGISLFDSSNNQILDNVIEDSSDGINIESDGSNIGGSNTISRNTLTDSVINGIYIESERNTISENTITGDGVPASENYGIYVNFDYMNPYNNNIKDNEISGYYEGIYADYIYPKPESANSQTHAWYSTYENDQDTSLYRTFDLTEADNASLKFSMWYSIEEDYDYLDVYVNDSLVQSYNADFVNWEDYEIDLTEYVGSEVNVTLNFYTDGSVIYSGVYLDDFELFVNNRSAWRDNVESGADGWTVETNEGSDWEIVVPTPLRTNIESNDIHDNGYGLDVEYSFGIDSKSNSIHDNCYAAYFYGLDDATIYNMDVKDNGGSICDDYGDDSIPDHDEINSVGGEGRIEKSNDKPIEIFSDRDDNTPERMDDSGVYIGASNISMINGNFEDNNNYGLYQDSDSLSWYITGPTTCKNNDIEITNGFIMFNGGTLTTENCTITADYSEYLSILPGENDTVEGEAFYLEVHSDDGYDGTITVTTSPTMPENYSGYTLTPFGTWMTFEAPDLNENMSWAIIKIYYTDEQLAALNMDEDSLVIQYYNATDETWEIFSDPKGGLGSDDNGKYVWANTTHFSGFGLFGSTIVTSTGGATMAVGGANVTYVAPGEEGTQPEVPSESIVTPIGEIPTNMMPIIVLVVLVGLGIVAYTMLKPKKKR